MDNYKIAIIFQNDDPEHNIEDGQIDKFGDINGEDCHATCLLNYLNKKYPDISIFQRLNYRHRPETICYFIAKLGHVVFLNTTSDIDKYGKTGILIMPDHIEEENTASLCKFTDTIDDFSIQLNYNLVLNEGILDFTVLQTSFKHHPKQLIETYLENINPSRTK